MIGLAWSLARAQSLRRLATVAAIVAGVTALILVGLAIVDLPSVTHEPLFLLLADADLRGGVVLALALLTAPLFLLLHQVVLLGAPGRERRSGLLRIVGATPVQLRVLHAFEVGLPAAVGLLAGWGLYVLLRVVLGSGPGGRGPGLVPTATTPTPPQLLGAGVAVLIAVLAVGSRAGRSSGSAIATVRRQPVRTPRAWGAVGVLVGALGLVAITTTGAVSIGWTAVFVGSAATGLMLLGPWLAARAGRLVVSRARTVAGLLGGRRLLADPWAAGRAAAPLGAVGLAGGGVSVFTALLVINDQAEPFYVLSLLLVVVLALAALLLVAFALIVHAVDLLAQHRRATAALAAAGVPEVVLSRSVVIEAAAVGLPSVVAGVLVGGLGLSGLAVAQQEETPVLAASLLATVVALVVLSALVALASLTAGRLVRPWLRWSLHADGLRTE